MKRNLDERPLYATGNGPAKIERHTVTDLASYLSGQSVKEPVIFDAVEPRCLAERDRPILLGMYIASFRGVLKASTQGVAGLIP